NETTTGGNALKFYASVRLDVRRIATLKKNDVPYGNRIVVKVVKNKVAPPFTKVEVDLIFGFGVSREFDLLDMALQHNIVTQNGAWFFLGEEKLAQGRDNTGKRLQEQELFDRVYKMVTQRLQVNGSSEG
ncbi:MAG: recombination protein RecA, partial [Candidatus Dependentiae bacterium]|nr:recombination protein RecA [Candidatus Dependentiae bacterium]